MITKEEAIDLIKAEYKRLDQITRLNTESIEIKISSRLKSTYGYFSVKKNKSVISMSITISDKIFFNEKFFYDVIRHEYAHAAVYLLFPNENHGHDRIWKSVCLLVGCPPKATFEDPNGEEKKPASNPAKYIVRCEKCGLESRYMKEGKFLQILLGKRPGSLSCRKCGGQRFKIYRLR